MKLFRVDIPEWNTSYALMADSAEDAEDMVVQYLRDTNCIEYYDGLEFETCEQQIVEFCLPAGF